MTSPVDAAWSTAALVVVLGWRLQPRARVRRVEAASDQDDITHRTSPASRGGSGASGRLSALSLPGRSRRRGAGAAQWCDDLARAVRGGSTLTVGLRSSAPPTATSLEGLVRDVSHQLERGHTLAEALRQQTAQSETVVLDPDTRLVFTVLEQCAATGGSSAEPLERAAAVLRSREAARAEVAAQSASARLSAVVLTLLPMAMLLMLLVTSPTTREAVVSPVGLGVVTIGLLLNLIGWRWMRRLVGAVR